jgi:hypothetical protein
MYVYVLSGQALKQNIDTLTNEKPHIIVGTPGIHITILLYTLYIIIITTTSLGY